MHAGVHAPGCAALQPAPELHKRERWHGRLSDHEVVKRQLHGKDLRAGVRTHARVRTCVPKGWAGQHNGQACVLLAPRPAPPRPARPQPTKSQKRPLSQNSFHFMCISPYIQFFACGREELAVTHAGSCSMDVRLTM